MNHFTVNPHIVSLIDGKDAGQDGKTIPVIYPGDGKQVSVLHEADAHTVDAAVKAAHRAFASWSKTAVVERQRYMYAIADALEKHADELAYLECLNAGLVMRDVRASFGDTKQSGIGRDGRYSCAEFFSEEKTVSIPYAPLALHKLGAGD